MHHRQQHHRHMVDQWRSALRTGNFKVVGTTLGSDVRFGSCIGRPQVIAYLGRMFGQAAVASVDIETLPDRLIATLAFKATGAGMPEQRFRTVVGFVVDDQLVELQGVSDHDQARTARITPDPPPRPDRPTRLSGMAAVLPVRDLAAALRHYQQLGFEVSAYEGGGYGYGERDGLNLHFCVVRDLDPATTTSAVYVYVDDADLLYAEWRSAGVNGQFFEPADTNYGLREGAHVDLDGNLLRFGSRLRCESP